MLLFFFNYWYIILFRQNVGFCVCTKTSWHACASQIHPKYYHFKSGLNVSVCTFVFVFRLRSCTVFFALQALLNLGTSDPSLRLAAYNLLCSVTKSFNLKIEERLLEGTGKDINATKTPVINHNTKFWWSCTVSDCLAENIKLWLRKLSLVFGESDCLWNGDTWSLIV